PASPLERLRPLPASSHLLHIDRICKDAGDVHRPGIPRPRAVKQRTRAVLLLNGSTATEPVGNGPRKWAKRRGRGPERGGAGPARGSVPIVRRGALAWRLRVFRRTAGRGGRGGRGSLRSSRPKGRRHSGAGTVARSSG